MFKHVFFVLNNSTTCDIFQSQEAPKHQSRLVGPCQPVLSKVTFGVGNVCGGVALELSGGGAHVPWTLKKTVFWASNRSCFKQKNLV